MDILENYPVTDYGKLIYHYRINTGITQHELASGICSITYLSKLENNKLDNANEETINLLMKRLNVDFTSSLKSRHEIKDLLEEWYRLIKIRNITKAKELYLKLGEYFSGEVLAVTLKYWFDLISIRHLLLLNDLDKANKLVNTIKEYDKNLNQEQSCYFIYFKGILACVEKKHSKGLTLLSQAETKFKELKNDNDELFYHLALTHSYLNNITLAIYYGEKALELFNKMAYYPRSIDCQLILAINYTRVKKFEEAKNYYNNLLEISKSSGDTTLTGKILNNLGFLYSEAGDYSKSIDYYLNSLNYKHPAEANYGNTIYGLVEGYLSKNDVESALKMINKGLSNLHPEDITNKVKLTIKKLEIKEDISLKEYLEDVVLPFFKEDYINLYKTYEKLATIHSENFQYKKSSYYYSLSINLRNRMNNEEGGNTV
ncbi:tetratricopeptide repeat protein [Virgibacillus sp. DJP39]|uniref:tetratricopeptide repeat protein n=1 Tax=Virgibacillus sp. DJP39 TaxID=3409790 RepID=UPI003BB5D6E2